MDSIIRARLERILIEYHHPRIISLEISRLFEEWNRWILLHRIVREKKKKRRKKIEKEVTFLFFSPFLPEIPVELIFTPGFA